MPRRFEVMHDVVEGVVTAKDNLSMITGSHDVVIENTQDAERYADLITQSYANMWEAEEILMRQKWGFLNTDF